jgi:flagellar basal-body rod protein FlgB
VAGGDPGSATTTVSTTDDPSASNGNNVNLDNEMVIATESQLHYQLLSTAVNAKFDLLSTVIKG